MHKLNTIQKQQCLNTVHAMGTNHPVNNAIHKYCIVKNTNDDVKQEDILLVLQFQNGARKESDSVHGIIDSDLLEIVKHRLECFQDGQFACKENAEALEHLTKCLEAMNKRVEDRINRNVLGENKK